MQHIGDLLNRKKPVISLPCGHLPSLLRCGGLRRNFFRVSDTRLLIACVIHLARDMSSCGRCVLALFDLCWGSLHTRYAASLNPPPFSS
jgi:hypothetical protein